MFVRTTPVSNQRSGFSLLEVLVSLAIFLLCLVALARLIGMGSDFARDAQQQTECNRLAQSKLNEVVAGIEPLQTPATDSDIPEDPNYKYTITADQDPNTTSIWYVSVTVYRERGDKTKMSVTLNHITLDPTARGTVVIPTAPTTGQ